MINGYINDYASKYAPEYGKGMTNHLPMAQAALYQLTEDMDAVALFSEAYIHHTALDRKLEDDRLITDIKEALGDRSAYQAYVRFFDDWVAREGVSEVLEMSLQTLASGLLGGAFHSTIRLAYGLDLNNNEEIVRGLAYMAAAYLPLPVAKQELELAEVRECLSKISTNPYFMAKKLEPGLFEDVLGQIFKDPKFEEVNFRIKAGGIEQYKLIIGYAIETYLRTGSFLSLHTITALHAISVLEPYTENFDEMMTTYVVAFIGCLLSLKDGDTRVQADTYQLKDWDVALTYALSSHDAHTIKFIYSCHELYNLTGNDHLLKAVGIKLTQDKTL